MFDNIIFIHGKDRTKRDFIGISKRLPEYNHYYIEYKTPQEGMLKLTKLINTLNLSKTAFICHSFGGLIVKKVIEDIDYSGVIINISTPSVYTPELEDMKSDFSNEEFSILLEMSKKGINSNISLYSFTGYNPNPINQIKSNKKNDGLMLCLNSYNKLDNGKLILINKNHWNILFDRKVISLIKHFLKFNNLK